MPLTFGYRGGMEYDGLDGANCPECGVVLRERPTSLECPACGWSIDVPPVEMPPEFDGPDFDERRAGHR